MEWLQLVLAILAGLSTAIPLIIKLIEYIKKSIQEKNWQALLALVINNMTIAEEKFSTGAERKEWVLATVKEAATTINYDVDITVISTLIDNLCTMSKKINIDTKK